MYLVDYHTHSHHSPDGTPTVDQMCLSALNAGISELCLTDHYDVNEGEETAFRFEPEALLYEHAESADKYRGRLKLLAGVEVGQATQNRAESSKLYSDPRFDFVIGSLHNLKDERDFYFLEYPDVETCHAYLKRYFVELLEHVNFTGFDVLGHISYPLRYMRGRAGIPIDFSSYTEQIRAIFKILIENGCGIELNTSGLRQGLGETMPPMDLIKLYKDCGGEIITVGSDAHLADHIGSGLIEGYNILKASGFEYVTVYEKREARFVKI